MRPLFVGGAGRSGTTLLADLLGARSDHLVLPETSYMADLVRLGFATAQPQTAAGLEAVSKHPKFKALTIETPTVETVNEPSLRGIYHYILTRYAAAVGKSPPSVWIDHTPHNVMLGKTLLDHIPDARLIHLVRDGRAVAASLIPLDWGPANAHTAARFWMRALAFGLALETAYPTRVLRVRYEDLVRAPEATLRRICTFAEVDFVPAMLQGGGFRLPATTAKQHALVGKPPDPSRIEAWRTTLPASEIEIFESQVGSLLELLGYEPVYGPAARRPTLLRSLYFSAEHLVRDLGINRRQRRRRLRT